MQNLTQADAGELVGVLARLIEAGYQNNRMDVCTFRDLFNQKVDNVLQGNPKKPLSIIDGK